MLSYIRDWLVPKVAAQVGNCVPGSPGCVDTCPVDSLSCTGDLGGYFLSTIVQALSQQIFFSFLLGMLTFYAIKMLLGSSSESIVTESRRAYLYAFIGAVLVTGAGFFASTVLTGGTPDPTGIETIFTTLTDVLAVVVSTALAINIVYQAFRLIVADEDGQRDSARKQIIFGFVGAVVVVLANSIVDIFFNNDPELAIIEIEGIIRFLATILGILSVLGIIMSGVFLIISYDESLRDRARKLFIASIVVLIVALAAYAIVGFFIFPTIA